jgi:hypothetical protein
MPDTGGRPRVRGTLPRRPSGRAGSRTDSATCVLSRVRVLIEVADRFALWQFARRPKAVVESAGTPEHAGLKPGVDFGSRPPTAGPSADARRRGSEGSEQSGRRRRAMGTAERGLRRESSARCKNCRKCTATRSPWAAGGGSPGQHQYRAGKANRRTRFLRAGGARVGCVGCVGWPRAGRPKIRRYNSE